MKKIVSTVMCACLALFLSGCKKNLIVNNSELNSFIDSDAKIESNNKVYECHILYNPGGICHIQFQKPESIKGLDFLWENGKYKISMQELSGEFNLEPLCDKSGVSELVKIFEVIKNKENLTFISKEEGEEILKGKTDSSEFEIFIDKDGNILHINLPAQSFRIDFKNNSGKK